MKALERTPIIEALVLTAILVLLELYLVPGSLIQWNPSPLWLIVLLIAMRYGSPAGLLGGGVAAALHLWELVRGGHTLQQILHLNPGLLVGPVLYLIVGLLLGEAREKLARRGDHYKNLTDELTKQLDTSEIKRHNLERARLDLEKRIAGQTDTLRSVYDNLNQLNTAATERELWDLLTEITRREMHAEVCGVWQMSPPELMSVTGAWVGNTPGLATLAVKKRGVVTAVDWTDSELKGSPDAEMAGLLSEDTDNPVVLTVSGMGFNNLNRGAVIFFDLIVQRANLVLRELRRIADLRRASISDPELGLTSESYLRNRIHEQTLLARRYKTDLTLLGCAFKKEPPRNLADRLEVILACSIRAAVRGSDGIAFFPDNKTFVVMLPGTDVQGASVVATKVSANLKQLELTNGDGNSPMDLKWSVTPVKGGEDDIGIYQRLFTAMGDGLKGSGS